MLDLLWGTFLIRPYVFVFLIAFIAIATVQMGWRRMVAFSTIGFLFGFGSEAYSVRANFPYGSYEYLSYATRGRELWLCDVPLMASFSFIFMTYAGLAMAMVAYGKFDRRGLGMRFVDSSEALQKPALLVLAPLFTVVLDIVIDPVALQGKKWFLGDLYRYHSDGFYFGVPLTNFAGWLLVSFLIVASFQGVDRWLNLGAGRAPNTGSSPPAWPGVGLYGGILAFNVTVTFAIGQVILGLASSLISLVALAVVAHRFVPLKKSTGEVHQ